MATRITRFTTRQWPVVCGRFIVIARNGESVDGATRFDWPTDLDAIAETIDWNGGDLFPHLGMTSLGA
jgi:hypothetical protein